MAPHRPGPTHRSPRRRTRLTPLGGTLPRPPAQRDVRESAGHGVARRALATALVAPVVGLEHAALEHRVVDMDLLAGGRQTEPIEQAEGVEIRTAESSVGQRRGLPDGGVRTSIIGRPRPLPGDRRADRYTLNCDEPPMSRNRLRSCYFYGHEWCRTVGQDCPFLHLHPRAATRS
jgi:hypothetical protein